ncbi:MAG TPA: YeeE/YedE family protein [Burkholderiales bacterium]
MENPAHIVTFVILSGFVLAVIFGAVSQKTDFCTMGAVADIVNMNDWGRMRMWLLAIAVAVAGANALDLAGLVDLSRSAYPGARWPWLAYLSGGFLFGVGMTLGSGCGSRSVVRLGGGNLKSLVVLLFLALSAQMTLRGVFAPAREWVSTIAAQFDQGQDLSWLLAVPLGIGKRSVQPWIATAVTLGLTAFVLKDRDFRADYERLFAGAVIGLVIVGGWYVTGHLGFVAEDPETLQEAWLGTRTARPESFTFIGPAANTLELLQFWADKSARMTFGVAVVLGTLAGSFAYAALKRRFRWEGFRSGADTRNHILGGILMGFGGVTAMGCTIGQGVTGVSTLALGSILTLFSIIAGAAVTMKLQYRRMLRET